MAPRVCEPMAPSIEPGEIPRRASATCASSKFFAGRGKAAATVGGTAGAFEEATCKIAGEGALVFPAGGSGFRCTSTSEGITGRFFRFIPVPGLFFDFFAGFFGSHQNQPTPATM